MSTTASLDLSSLYRSPVFRTHSTETSQHELSRAITDHEVRWGRGRVAAELHKRDLRRLSLMLLTYGAEVEVRPHAFPDFALVQMPLVGHTEIECDGQSLSLQAGEVALLSPRHDLRLLWSEQCQQIIVKVPHALAQLAGQGRSPWSSPVFKLREEHGPVWQAMVQQMLALVPAQHQGVLHTPWVDGFEASLVSFLQAHQPSYAGETVEATLSGQELRSRVGQVRIEQLEAYLDQHPGTPLTLVAMAQVIGVSERTLNALCQQWRRCTPMELLRSHRLDLAHRRLCDGSGDSVTEVALECGFAHLGRFSAYYRERFGQTPGQTRLRALAGVPVR